MNADSSCGETTSDHARLWWIAIGLAMGPAVSNGLARFSYGLILPAMRDDLAWIYTQAGWVNTANAIGYLAGSVLALALVSRIGPARLFIWGMGLTALALLLSALSRDLWVLTLWRVVAGIGGAPAFIAGGAMASAIFAAHPARNALVIAIYFGGGGLGMLATAVALPPYLAWTGDAGWPAAWLMLGGASCAAFVPAWLAARKSPVPARATEQSPAGRLPLRALSPALVTYFLFGVGYIIYVTFLIAWMHGQGAGPGLIATTWGVMGIAVMLSQAGAELSTTLRFASEVDDDDDEVDASET